MTTQQTPITLDMLDEESLAELRKQVNAELREHAEAVLGENKGLRKRVLEGDMRTIGLDPEKGLGVAVVDTYDGELTLEALTTHVTEKYSYEIPKTEQATQQQAAATEQALAQTEQAMQQVQGVSTSLQPAGDGDRAQEVEGKMNDPEAGRDDAIASMSSKLGRLLEQNPLGP